MTHVRRVMVNMMVSMQPVSDFNWTQCSIAQGGKIRILTTSSCLSSRHYNINIEVQMLSLISKYCAINFHQRQLILIRFYGYFLDIVRIRHQISPVKKHIDSRSKLRTEYKDQSGKDWTPVTETGGFLRKI